MQVILNTFFYILASSDFYILKVEISWRYRDCAVFGILWSLVVRIGPFTYRENQTACSSVDTQFGLLTSLMNTRRNLDQKNNMEVESTNSVRDDVLANTILLARVDNRITSRRYQR